MTVGLNRGQEQRSTFAVFRHRSFTLLWVAQFVSTIGSAAATLAGGVMILRLTGSAFLVGLLEIAGALPGILVGLVAGVFVDQWDRKRVMLAGDGMRAALYLLLPLLLGYGSVWVYIVFFLSGIVKQFFEPAQASALPDLIPDDELGAANGLMQISTMGAAAAGFILAGLLVSYLPISAGFYLNGASYLVSALCTITVRVLPVVSEGSTNVRAVVHNLRGGLTYLFHKPLLRSLYIICIPAFLGIGLFNTVLLPFAVRALQATASQYGLIQGLQAGGFIVGAVLMLKLIDRLHEGQWIAVSLLGVGVAVWLTGSAPSIFFAIGMNVILGVANAPHYVGRSLVIQRNTTREMRGRVNSAFMVTRNGLYLLGMAATGLADLVDVHWLMFTSAVLVFVSGAITLRLPGLGHPAAEWRRAIGLLRSARTAGGLGLSRAFSLADLDLLAVQLPQLGSISAVDRRSLAQEARVYEVPVGTVIVRQGDLSDAAYFILAGRAIAGRDDGEGRVLEVLNTGDFFGEIAALSAIPRTANVVAEEATTVAQVPSTVLHQLMNNPPLHRLFLSKVTERMARMNMIDIPGFSDLDQQTLRQLRASDQEAVNNV